MSPPPVSPTPTGGARRAALVGCAAGAVIGVAVGVLALGKVAGMGGVEVAGVTAATSGRSRRC